MQQYDIWLDNLRKRVKQFSSIAQPSLSERFKIEKELKKLEIFDEFSQSELTEFLSLKGHIDLQEN